MADKKKAGVSVVPEFVAGEQPSAEKFNAIGVQLERAASELEKAVGDIWGESWPYTDADSTKLTLPYGRKLKDAGPVDSVDENGQYLDIANIARLIGPASNLNPIILGNFGPEGSSADYIDNVSTFQLGPYAKDKREFLLPYPPSDVHSMSFSGASASTYFASRKSDHGLVTSSGAWHCDDQGRLTVWNAIPAGTEIYVTYNVKPVEWGNGPSVQGSTFNVIPDPNQIYNGGAGCTATLSGDGYLVNLPSCTHAKSNYNVTSSALDENDINYGQQLYLPKVLQENFVVGNTIPEGFLYIRDNETGKVYNDATYVYQSANSLMVKNVTLETSHSFSILTIGSTITDNIHDIRHKLYRHSHDGSFGEPLVHIKDIVGILEDQPTKGQYLESPIKGNWMPQYLHRDGYSSSELDKNDNNALRGHLVIGLNPTSVAAGQYVSSSTTGDSSDTYSICFGAEPNLSDPNAKGPALHVTDGALWVEGSKSGSTSLRKKGALVLGSSSNLFIEAGDRQWDSASENQPSGARDGNAGSDVRICSASSGDVKIGSGNTVIVYADSDIKLQSGNNAKLLADAQAQVIGASAIVKAESGMISISGNTVAGQDIEIKVKGDNSGSAIKMKMTDWTKDTTSTGRKGVHIYTNLDDTFYQQPVFQAHGYSNENTCHFLTNAIKAGEGSGGVLKVGFVHRKALTVAYDHASFIDFYCAKGGEINDLSSHDGGSSGDYHYGNLGRIRSMPRQGFGASKHRKAVWSTDSNGIMQLGGGPLRMYDGCVIYESGGSDFGEYMIAGDVDEWRDIDNPLFTLNDIEDRFNEGFSDKEAFGLPEGILVYVRNDEDADEGHNVTAAKFYRHGPGRPMLVTNSACVAGNGIAYTLGKAYEVISFIGQLRVFVRGPCKQGDLLVPEEELFCRAVDPDEISFAEYRSALGTVLSKNHSLGELADGHEYNYVLAATGVK